jgi:methyl-accepting chemotaxis protein
MQAGRERVEKGRDDVQATGDSFSGIRTSVETVHSKAGAITAMMSELQEHVQSIVASSSSINDAAKKVGGESQTVSAAEPGPSGRAAARSRREIQGISRESLFQEI